MDPVTRLAALTGEELSSEARALQAIEAAKTEEAPGELKALHDRLPKKGTTVGLHVYWARALGEAGQIEEADRTLLAVAERLNQAGYWRALAHLLEPLLDRHPHTVAPLLARARSHGGSEAVPDAVLEAAYAILPHHGLLAWQVAETRLAAGDEEGARGAAAAALLELAAEKDYDTAEMALLLLAEDRSPGTIRTLVQALDVFGKQGAWDSIGSLVAVAGDALAEKGAIQTWPVVRHLWERNPENEDLRALATRVVRGVFLDYPDPAALVRISEIERPSQPAPAVLARLQKALRFPPGYYVRHSGWGIGRILDNDTEQVIIDFPGKPSHRMSFATAETALDVLPPGDLRVLQVVSPEEPGRLAKKEPATLLTLALSTLPEGKGTADALRKFLVPVPIAAAQWAAWWKRAKEAATRDPRIDSRRAYENVYRLVDGSEASSEAVELPPWSQGKDPAGNLAVFSTFLEHHPERTADLLGHHGPRVREIALDPVSSPETRVAAILWLTRHGEGGDLDAAAHVEVGFAIGSLSKAEQEELVGRLSSPEGLAAALNSRWVSVRRRVWQRMEEGGHASAVTRLVLGRSAELPEGSLYVLEFTGSHAALAADPSLPPLLLGALFDLLERPLKETHRKRAMALLQEDSALQPLIVDASWTEEDTTRLVTRLKAWQGSDRHRFPILGFLGRAGLAEVTEAVEGHRARMAARLSQRLHRKEDDPYADSHLLTRPTLEKLQAERTRLGMELKTTIPRAIQRARELGDLRENAEYDAAKAKQASYARRFEELDTLFDQARLIESLPRPADIVLPGTEVALEPAAGGDPLLVWVLGEGDQELGERVVSYKAPIGQALLRKRVGDEVTLPHDGEEAAYRVQSVRERLP